jgi:hypothetical protein
MMEGIFTAMLFFIGLKVLLKQKDEEMGKRRGKRKKKFHIVDDNGLVVITNTDKPKKPFENIKLLPPRDAQDGTGK